MDIRSIIENGMNYRYNRITNDSLYLRATNGLICSVDGDKNMDDFHNIFIEIIHDYLCKGIIKVEDGKTHYQQPYTSSHPDARLSKHTENIGNTWEEVPIHSALY